MDLISNEKWNLVIELLTNRFNLNAICTEYLIIFKSFLFSRFHLVLFASSTLSSLPNTNSVQCIHIYWSFSFIKLNVQHQLMAAKLKACQEIMPPPQLHQQQQQQQQRRKHQPYMSAVQKSASSSLKSLNGSLNTSRISVANELDETLPSEQSLRKTTAI